MKKIISLIAVAVFLMVMTGCSPSTNKSDANSALAISEEKAKAIALERAGLAEDEVIFDRVEFDRDDGVEHYEVEFRKDRTEYDADIATDGTILSWEVDND